MHTKIKYFFILKANSKEKIQYIFKITKKIKYLKALKIVILSAKS